MSEFVVMENVKKTYKMGEVMIHAVDGVDIEIHKGEFAVIVGPSGAGKTTVLNMLGGMDRVTSGKVIVDGRDISLYNSRQLTKYRRDDIGFVFQFYNLVPTLTVHENVALVKEIVPNSFSATKMIEEVGLSDHLKNFPA
jgi:putative ABC transport system ATP-binding protein